jgi:site-specific DNA recombinase
VLDELNQMNKERKTDQNRLDSLIQTKENVDKMIDIEGNLKELCARIIPDLDNRTNQDKKDAYTYLDLKIKANPERADIKGYLDSSVINGNSSVLLNGQSSGCLSSQEYDYLIPFSFSINN